MSEQDETAKRAPRPWGYWTRAKLQILSEYLGPFLTASQSQPEAVYIDAFAGEGEGVDRVTGERFKGSAVRGLEATSANGSQFTKLRYFERDSRATALEARLRAEFPGRDIKVHAGDCNSLLHEALDELSGVRWAPTFAFVDPDGLEVDWETLRLLSMHKGRDARYKTEIWLLFSSPAFMRVLGLARPMTDEAAEQVTRSFGSDDWRPIYEMRKSGRLTADEARSAFVNLMRWRLERVLGYRWTHPLLLKTETGVPIYHMIFATDNEAGNRIMSAIYKNASQALPEMAREAREQRAGAQLSLNTMDDATPVAYRYEPPTEPPEADELDGPAHFH